MVKSGQYASYWNAFCCSNKFLFNFEIHSKTPHGGSVGVILFYL